MALRLNQTKLISKPMKKYVYKTCSKITKKLTQK